MENNKNWAELTWQEKREERFKRWLSPPDVNFVNSEAEKLYKARVTRFIRAIKLEEPDRVPVMLPLGTSPAYYAGSDFRTILFDYKVMREAWIKFMEDFGDMDYYSGPAYIPCGRIQEALDSRVTLIPGRGLPPDATMHQVVEAEYMLPDEYDWLIMDPSDYYIRVQCPRTTGLLEPFKKLPPLRHLQGVSWVDAMTDPEIRQTFQTLMNLADEYAAWKNANREIGDYLLSHGYPSFRGGVMAGAPFDIFADLLRGTRGISLDMRRQPEKLHEAMEAWLKLFLKQIKNYPMTECPVCIMPLHKGDDTFMSDQQFEEFYWPYLRRTFMAMIEEGLVPMPFAEGRFTRRLRQIADTPKSAVIWYFDQTDMAQAKKILGDICCIAGNVPTSVVMTATPQEVKEHCRRLIETCAPGGGYILTGGAQIDKCNFPNLKAMMEAAYEYGVYGK